MNTLHGAPAGARTAEDDVHSRYLANVLGVLYPAPCDIDDWYGEVVAEYLAIPDLRRVRMLVPAGSRKLAVAAARRSPQPRPGWFTRDALVAALRTGAASMLLQDRVRITAGPGHHRQEVDTIDTYLRGVFGEPLRLSVHIAGTGGDRRPLLQLLRTNGHTLGFAKLGMGGLSGLLVRAEAMALAKLARADLRLVRAPRLVHAGVWRDHEVVAQTALPFWKPRVPIPPDDLAAAMREVAECMGVSHATLGTSGYWRRLRDRQARVGGDPDGRTLSQVAELLATRVGSTTLRFGACHGDWVPRHMASVGGSLLVWDWERFALDVPIGFDVLHHHLHSRTAMEPPEQVVPDMLAAAGRLLAPFAVPAEAARVTALLYLLDLATRQVTDRVRAAGESSRQAAVVAESSRQAAVVAESSRQAAVVAESSRQAAVVAESSRQAAVVADRGAGDGEAGDPVSAPERRAGPDHGGRFPTGRIPRRRLPVGLVPAGPSRTGPQVSDGLLPTLLRGLREL